MSPQRLSSLIRKGRQKRAKKPLTLTFSMPRHMPDHCTLIAEVIATCARIENFFLQIAIDNTTDPESFIAIWKTLNASSTQGVAVHAAITHCLREPEDRRVFDEAWRAFGTARKIRNQFAHSLWAYADDLPGVLLLVEPTHMVSHDARLEVERRAIASTDPSKHPEDLLDAAKVMVYTLEDLQREARDMAAVLTTVAIARMSLIPLDPGHDALQTALPGVLGDPQPLSALSAQSPPQLP